MKISSRPTTSQPSSPGILSRAELNSLLLVPCMGSSFSELAGILLATCNTLKQLQFIDSFFIDGITAHHIQVRIQVPGNSLPYIFDIK